MKKYKYILITILIPLLIPITAYADCSEEDIKEFREIQDEYKVAYEFDKETKTYILTFNSTSSENFEYTITENVEAFADCEATEDKKMICKNIPSGKYVIEVTGSDENCQDTLKKIEMELPRYNEYSEDPLCNDIEEFVLCQPTYDKEIDYDTFVSRVNTYKKNHKETSEEPQKTQEETIESKIFKYIKDNIVQIIIITVFVIMIIITIVLTVKSEKQSRRLE